MTKDKKDEKAEIKYLKTWELALATYYMLNSDPIILDEAYMKFNDEYCEYSSKNALSYSITNLSINDQTLFKYEQLDIDQAKKIDVIYSKSKKVICPQKSKDEIRELLKEYIDIFRQDNCIDPLNKILPNPANPSNYKKCKKQFDSSIDKDSNLKDYAITKLKDLPIILDGYFQDKLDIKYFNIKFPNAEQCNNIMYTVEVDEKDWPLLIDNFWIGHMIIDVSNYFKKPNAKRKNSSYTKMEIEFYIRVKELVEKGKHSIYCGEIEKIIQDKIDKNKSKKETETVSKFISEFNKKYAAINHGKKLIGRKFSSKPKGYEIIDNPT